MIDSKTILNSSLFTFESSGLRDVIMDENGINNELKSKIPIGDRKIEYLDIGRLNYDYHLLDIQMMGIGTTLIVNFETTKEYSFSLTPYGNRIMGQGIFDIIYKDELSKQWGLGGVRNLEKFFSESDGELTFKFTIYKVDSCTYEVGVSVIASELIFYTGGTGDIKNSDINIKSVGNIIIESESSNITVNSNTYLPPIFSSLMPSAWFKIKGKVTNINIYGQSGLSKIDFGTSKYIEDITYRPIYSNKIVDDNFTKLTGLKKLHISSGGWLDKINLPSSIIDFDFDDYLSTSGLIYDFSNTPFLEKLSTARYGNKNINITKNINLKSISISDTNGFIDMSKNINLEEMMFMYYFPAKHQDLSFYPKLKKFYIYNGNTNTLDFSKNLELESLIVRQHIFNGDLDLSNNLKLKILDMSWCTLNGNLILNEIHKNINITWPTNKDSITITYVN